MCLSAVLLRVGFMHYGHVYGIWMARGSWCMLWYSPIPWYSYTAILIILQAVIIRYYPLYHARSTPRLLLGFSYAVRTQETLRGTLPNRNRLRIGSGSDKVQEADPRPDHFLKNGMMVIGVQLLHLYS